MDKPILSQWVTETGEKIPLYLPGPWLFTKLVNESDRIPDWHGLPYGFCWHDPWAYRSVFAPVPLNFIYGALYNFRNFLRRGLSPDWHTRKVQEAYAKGRAAAREEMERTHYDFQQLRRAYHRGKEHAFAEMWLEYKRQYPEGRIQ